MSVLSPLHVSAHEKSNVYTWRKVVLSRENAYSSLRTFAQRSARSRGIAPSPAQDHAGVLGLRPGRDLEQRAARAATTGELGVGDVHGQREHELGMARAVDHRARERRGALGELLG